MSEQSAGRGTPPEITPQMRANALANPNTWLYVIDPAFDADADIPPWGVVGAYPVNARGEIDAAFRRNTEYRPSPVALRAPGPANDLEQALWRVRSGELDQSALPGAVLAATLLVYATSAQDSAVTGFPAPHGGVVVPACTSAARVPAAWPGWREVAGRDLVPLLQGHPLVLNPAGPVSAMLPAEHLRRASG